MKTNKNLINNKNIFLIYILYVLSFYFIDWTVDWDNYDYLLYHIEDYDTDFIYTKISEVAFKYRLKYEDVYKFHILIEGIFFSLFINKITDKPFVPTIFFILLNFVNVANQIRFFVGLFMFLYGMTFYKKNVYVYYILGIIACLNHITLIILFFLIPFRTFLLNISLKNYILVVLFTMILLPYLSHLVPSFLSLFTKYLSDYNQSSLFGGIFMLFPVLFYAVIYFKIENSRKQRIFTVFSLQQLKLILCAFSFIVIPLSLTFHIFSHRFIFPFILSWTIYLFENWKTNKKNFKICLLGVFSILWFYLASEMILGYSYYWDNLKVMFGLKSYLNV